MPNLTPIEPGMTGTARISHDLRYRYRLERRWDIRGASGDGALWVMLNPSTADAKLNDATLRRCISFSRGFGFSSLTVVNLFALRSTDPKALLRAEDPLGPDNDATIGAAAREAQAIIVAWGAWGSRFPERADQVANLLSINSFYAQDLHCLGHTDGGDPRHPVRLAADTALEKYRPARVAHG